MVRATAVGWYDTAYPGWLDVPVVDAAGRVHRIVEKVPALTRRTVERGRAFPPS